jgi:FkbM family methyltransferase
MLAALQETTSPGDLVIDLGCHVGTFTVGAALLGRKTISVDADPLHVDLVTKSLGLNGLEGSVIHRAISSSRSPVGFIRNGLYGMIDYGGTRSNATVETIGLDEVVAQLSDDAPVRFVKMDIEGAELQAFMSGRKLLAEHRPVIWWESNGPNLILAGSTIDEARSWLEDCGYKTFRIWGDRWIHAPPGQIQPEAWLDVISIHESALDRWADRIDWSWDESAMLATCRHWMQFDQPNIIGHLMQELERLPPTPAVKELKELGRQRAAA